MNEVERFAHVQGTAMLALKLVCATTLKQLALAQPDPRGWLDTAETRLLQDIRNFRTDDAPGPTPLDEATVAGINLALDLVGNVFQGVRESL